MRPAGAPAGSGPSDPSASVAGARTVRILVVEDESSIAAAIKMSLEAEGNGVDVVSAGQDALDWADAVPYGLVILDVVLGGMSGFEVCSALRHRGFVGPILMLTALTSVEDRVTGL